MTEEEMDEYAEHAAAGYDRWQKLVKGHAVSEEEFARFLMWKFNDLVRRRGKECVKARLDKGVEYYTQRLGDGKWLKEFERAHKAHSKDWQPERVDGVATVRSDIFSAGALMYWLVFGSMPWGADIDWKSLWAKVLAVPLAERQDHIVRLLRERLSLLTERRRTPLPIPDKKLIDINERQLLAMTRALSPDPDKRFASAQEFLDALGVETGADDSTDARADETDSAARLDDLSDCNSADDTDDDDSKNKNAVIVIQDKYCPLLQSVKLKLKKR